MDEQLGVVVLNLKMPKDCPQCLMANYNVLDQFTGCNAVPGKKFAMTKEPGYADTSERPGWCPLVEVKNIKETSQSAYVTNNL